VLGVPSLPFVYDHRANLPEVACNSYIIKCSYFSTGNYSVAEKEAIGLLPNIRRYLTLPDLHYGPRSS